MKTITTVIKLSLKIISFKHQGLCFLRVFRNYADQKSHDFYRVTKRKVSLKQGKCPYKRSTIKDQKSNYVIPLDLRKRSSKIR